uniref:Uncharacterized protein n=1 Tax=Hainan hebius popei arterivirus TaxID=2116439 RepID=A0A2P1GNN0_9NIDO|nr:hypothetical protein [Hainan hebius popei arterivirus]
MAKSHVIILLAVILSVTAAQAEECKCCTDCKCDCTTNCTLDTGWGIKACTCKDCLCVCFGGKPFTIGKYAFGLLVYLNIFQCVIYPWFILFSLLAALKIFSIWRHFGAFFNVFLHIVLIICTGSLIWVWLGGKDSYPSEAPSGWHAIPWALFAICSICFLAMLWCILSKLKFFVCWVFWIGPWAACRGPYVLKIRREGKNGQVRYFGLPSPPGHTWFVTQEEGGFTLGNTTTKVSGDADKCAFYYLGSGGTYRFKHKGDVTTGTSTIKTFSAGDPIPYGQSNAKLLA